ncbi:MAG: hypothetical protein ACI4R8_02460 [Candidatus Caccovivens sp.]
MKKLVLFLGFVFILSMSPIKVASAETSYFAKVQATSVYLCSTPSESSAMFEIPYSYFVKVEYSVDDYFKVTYKDITGYVKQDKVSLMKGTPTQAYANASYKIFVPYSLYESPNQNSVTVTQLPANSTLTYYGTKTGQQVTSTNSLWYFSSVDINGTTQFGYVFSGVSDALTNIGINNESFEIVSSDVLNTPAQTEFKSLSTGTKIILIVAISVPSVLILYFLIKPSKIMQITKTRNESKKQSKIKRHGDYFEFDESQL